MRRLSNTTRRYFTLGVSTFVVTLFAIAASGFGLKIPFYSMSQYSWYVIIQNSLLSLGIALAMHFGLKLELVSKKVVFLLGVGIGYMSGVAANILTEFMWYINPISRILGTFSHLQSIFVFFLLHGMYLSWLEGGITALIFQKIDKWLNSSCSQHQ